jgi:hypothetical protein
MLSAIIRRIAGTREAPHPADVEVERRQEWLRSLQHPNAVKAAVAKNYLREQGKYCLEVPVTRIPRTEATSVLDRWVKKNARR